MVTKTKSIAHPDQQNPLIMRCHRLMEAFAKSDDERDFYLDRHEGFLVYVDLDKSEEELGALEKELENNTDRYCPVPKLTFYEVKKLMEGFVNEKVYDIDTKEKLLDIIQSKEARENFLEFIYDHHSELEKWQQYYQERFRVRIIEWLRNNHFDFVFEEDLEMTKAMVEKLKMNTFTSKAPKDVVSARKLLVAKAKTYYSNEALNPRPKRGRPPKQVAKVETEPQFSQDIYLTIPKPIKSFLFAPDYHGAASIFTFSGKFTSEADLIAHKRQQLQGTANIEMQNMSQKLATLRSLSSHWLTSEKDQAKTASGGVKLPAEEVSFDDEDEDDDFESSKTQVATKATVKHTKPAIKEAPKKSVGKATSKPKMRLRPLIKKPVTKAVQREKIAPKKKQTSMRHLRPTKKK